MLEKSLIFLLVCWAACLTYIGTQPPVQLPVIGLDLKVREADLYVQLWELEYESDKEERLKAKEALETAKFFAEKLAELHKTGSVPARTYYEAQFKVDEMKHDLEIAEIEVRKSKMMIEIKRVERELATQGYFQQHFNQRYGRFIKK